MDILQRSLRQSQQYMTRTDDLLSHNIQIIFCKKIINSCHNTCGGIFDREYPIVCLPLHYSLHSISPCFHMKAFNIIIEVFPHGSITVSSLYPLKNNCNIVQRKRIHHFQFFFILYTMLCQKLILPLPADGHNLLKQFLSTQLVKFPMGSATQSLQFLSLPFCIQHLFTCRNLIFCHILTYLHSFFKEPDNLHINLINFISAFQ